MEQRAMWLWSSLSLETLVAAKELEADRCDLCKGGIGHDAVSPSRVTRHRQDFA